jgi:alkylation response protein AidB-like acyl-CoA dehydrogenase
MMNPIWEPEFEAADAAFVARADELSRSHFAGRAAEIDRLQEYPWDNVKRLTSAGLAGMFVPRQFGGGGSTLTAAAAVVERISIDCASTSAILCAYQLGAFPLLLAGTDAQKEQYLGALVGGEGVSFAISERGAGSDPAAMSASASPEGAEWLLRGEKYWIGNGGASRYYVAFVKTDPSAGARGISAFMVDKTLPGITIDEYVDKMGIRGTQTSNLKLDVRVRDSERVGNLNRAMPLALKTLTVGRVMVAAQSVGLALGAFQEATQRAMTRETFGSPIVDHQAVAFKLADIATEISAARLMLYEAAHTYDRGGDVAALAAMTKLFASEVSHRAADAAVQIWGGLGYCKPTKVERIYRDQRIMEIYEGTSEIQRLVISRAIRAAARP